MRPLRHTAARFGLALVVLGGAQVTVGPATAGATSAAAPRTNPAPVLPVRTVTLLTGDRVTVYGADAARYSITRGKSLVNKGFRQSWVSWRLTAAVVLPGVAG